LAMYKEACLGSSLMMSLMSLDWWGCSVIFQAWSRPSLQITVLEGRDIRRSERMERENKGEL